tara:strand:+ start:51 stop:200 length:150 start_codon:yes stop_codon:yes gene_type:complete
MIAAKISNVGENVIASINKDIITIIIQGTKNHNHPQKDGLVVIEFVLFV